MTAWLGPELTPTASDAGKPTRPLLTKEGLPGCHLEALKLHSTAQDSSSPTCSGNDLESRPAIVGSIYLMSTILTTYMSVAILPVHLSTVLLLLDGTVFSIPWDKNCLPSAHKLQRCKQGQNHFCIYSHCCAALVSYL